MTKRIINASLRIIVSFSLIGLLLFIMRQHLKDVLGLVLNIRIPFLIVAIICAFGSYFVISLRLKIFLAAQEINISVKEAVGLTVIGFFFNNFLPTAVGGDVVKAYYVSKKTKGKIDSFTAVFMDRLVGSFTLVCITLFAFIVLQGRIESKIVMWPVWILFFVIAVFLLLFFNEALAEKLSIMPSSLNVFKLPQKVYSSLSVFRNKKALFPKTFLVSAIAQGFSFTMVYFTIKGLNDFVPFMKVLLIMPLVCIASMFPSINGLGIREGAFLLLFKPFIGTEKAFAVSLLWLAVYLLVSIFGGFVYAFAKHGKEDIK